MSMNSTATIEAAQTVVSSPSAAALDALTAALAGRFRIPAQEVQQLRQRHGLSEAQLLQALIAPAAALARPPISSYHVGAVGLGDSGDVYIGVNVEFPGTPLNNSVHAEQNLLSNAAWHGETGIRRLAVSAAPCGHCRQFYSELACADTIRISFGSPPIEYSLAELLPQRFGPADLLDDAATPLLLQPQDNRIVLTEPIAAAVRRETGSAALESADSADSTAVQNGRCRSDSAGVLCRAAEAALTAANKAYAPYTRCPSGLALVTEDQEVHWGMYIESAAFNPSLGPLQTAFATAVRSGIATYDQVQYAVLVELAGAPVQHADNVRLVLSQVAPAAELIVLPARRKGSGGPA